MHYQVVIQESYTPDQFFDMVMDIDAYDGFLPYCAASRVIKHIDGSNCLAKMTITFKGIAQSYTSHVVHKKRDDGSYSVIATQHGSGPFSALETHWLFLPCEEGCEVHFTLEMKFKRGWLETLVGGMLAKVGPDMLAAFKDRAKELYGS